MRQEFQRALLPDAVQVVVEESHNGAAERHSRAHRGRFKRWNQPDQVHQQDKEKQRGQKRRELFTVVSNDLFTLVGDELMQGLREMLAAARLLHGEPRAYPEKNDEQDSDHQDLHGYRVVDGGRGVSGMESRRQRLKNCVHRPAEEPVQERSYPQLFHSS